MHTAIVPCDANEFTGKRILVTGAARDWRGNRNDDATQISELADLNARIRTEGTRNLIEAARRSGSPKILAQSVALQLPDGPDAQAVAELDRSVLAEGGVALRYGQFYGPGTYNEQQQPEEPRVHIDRAAERTVEAPGEPTGVVVIID